VTLDERVQAIVDCRFTERQARFLVLVMRHAGVCVPRQYARFAGVAHGGAKCNAFFDKLVRRGCAVSSDCIHNRARLYHVHHKPLYHAIGEPNSQWRRPVPARRAVVRLMLLDAVLASPDLNWLTTAAEKRTYLSTLTVATPAGNTPDGPVDVPFGRTLGAPRMFPIGIDPSGRAVLLYLATEPWTDGFRHFLQGHAALLRAVPEWTLRLVFPRPLDRLYDAYQTVIREELETPLHPATIGELKWYFEHRQQTSRGPVHPQTQAFLDVGANVFGTPRFTLLYRCWLKQGDAAFEAVSSPAIAEALSAGTARVECLVLPHTYRHLSPLVNHVRLTARGVEKRATKGDTAPTRRQPPPSTPPPESLTIAEQLTRDWHRLIGRS
jgi:hypothetical protein